MSHEDPLQVPVPTGKDALYAAGRGLLGIIPGAGSPAQEIFAWLLREPIERRRDEWMKEVGERLRWLEENRGIDFESLRNSSAFVDTVMQATHIAMRNWQADKRAALRNAISNSALPGAPEESLRQMFLHWIDQFTPWHLLILTLFHEPRKAWKGDSHMTCALSHVLETVYPELKGKRDLYDQIWRELKSAGLVTTDSLHGMMTPNGTLQRRTSDIGKKFILFIAEPQDAE